MSNEHIITKGTLTYVTVDIIIIYRIVKYNNVTMIDVRTYRASTLSYINNNNYKVTLLSKYEIKEIPEYH